MAKGEKTETTTKRGGGEEVLLTVAMERLEKVSVLH